jgi:hypothetical protein
MGFNLAFKGLITDFLLFNETFMNDFLQCLMGSKAAIMFHGYRNYVVSTKGNILMGISQMLSD